MQTTPVKQIIDFKLISLCESKHSPSIKKQSNKPQENASKPDTVHLNSPIYFAWEGGEIALKTLV